MKAETRMRRIQFVLPVLFLLSLPASALEGGLGLLDSCLITAWAPDDKNLGESPGWHDEKHRLSFVNDAPEGKTALAIFSKAHEPSGRTVYRRRLDQAMNEHTTAARISAEFFIPAETRFNVGGAKMPLGIWGGDPAADGICATGGCPPNKQTGFSLRLTRASAGNPDRAIQGPRLYSYNLNRPGTPKLRHPNNPDRAHLMVEMQFGDGFQMTTDFPSGEWFTLVIDLVLNDVRRSGAVSNGLADLRMYNEAGEMIGRVSADGLIYRETPNWHIFGPLLAELWGGNTSSPKRMPIMDTTTYSRNYQMFLLDPARVVGDCLTH